MKVGMVLIGVVACSTALGGERYIKGHALDAGHQVVVSEGEYEPRSVGSYAVRVYKTSHPDFPWDHFVCGCVRPRDGVVEKVLSEDLDGDGRKDLVVTLRSVGSGSYLSADALTLVDGKLILLGAVKNLAKEADPVAALKQKLAAPRGKRDPGPASSP